MFFPIGDDNSDRHSTPVVNYVLIAINILVFVFLQNFGQDIPFLFAYSTVPAEILSGTDLITEASIVTNPVNGQPEDLPGLQYTPVPVYLTLLTSMFMHGGIAHIAGNMMYLWICGDNLEHAMGHRNYFVFYIICGLLAGLSHVFSSLFSQQSLLIPSLGASGAISGVLAGYMLLFPKKHIHIWILLGIVRVPAILAVGLWFLFQLINGAGALGGEEAGGIAYAAHIGGFIAGLLLVKLFVPRASATLR